MTSLTSYCEFRTHSPPHNRNAQFSVDSNSQRQKHPAPLLISTSNNPPHIGYPRLVAHHLSNISRSAARRRSTPLLLSIPVGTNADMEVRGKSPWIKIKNPNYSQKEGRGELFQGDGKRIS